LLGCPISRSSLRLTLALNQGPFPPPALPGFLSTTGLSATLCRPSLALAGVWLNVRPVRDTGLPVLHRSSCADMPSPLSRRTGRGAFVARLPQPWQPSPRF
jgi:hypothetical protein